MAGDPLKLVKAGQPLRIPAVAYNLFVQAVKDLQQRRGPGSKPVPTQAIRQPSVALVKNDTGGARERFDIIALTAPLITVTDNEAAFKEAVRFVGATPADANAGQFGVLLGPLAAGSIGPAIVAGVATCKVEVHDTDHGWAEVTTAAGCAKLESCEEGSAQILWAQAGLGTKWALIRLGATPHAKIADGVAAVTQIEESLDLWVDITQATGGTVLSPIDWRGRNGWYSVRISEDTPANSDSAAWDDDGAEYQDVRGFKVGKTWNPGMPIVLWADDALQTVLYLEPGTGRLALGVSWGGTRHQLRITVRATAQKESADAGVPDIVI